MKYSLSLMILIGAVAAALPRRAVAQIVVIDDVILLTSRQKKMQATKLHEHLELPGGAFRMSAGPGADTPRLGEERIAVIPVSGLLSGRRLAQGQGGARLRLAPLPTLRSTEVPLYGPLELPDADEGPPDGLSLDAAIERLLAANYDLATKFQDIPKARADILTAGLRNNPFLFFSGSNLPYQHYSPQRPGAANYDLTLIQPIDVSGRHKSAVVLARQAKNVLEALYQDAVRLEIAKLYTAFADVLEARVALRAARAGVSGLEELVAVTRNLVDQGLRAQAELTTAQIRQSNARDALQKTDAALLKAQQNLATLLALPLDQAGSLAIRGSLRGSSSTLPPLYPPPKAGDKGGGTEELVQLALQIRPDLAAYRLGIARARADLQLARAESIDNAYVFYTPYTAVDYAPQNKQNVNGWGLGTLVSMPLFNRNQGNIARARVNVTQAQLEQKDRELQVMREVQEAAADFASSQAIVARYEREILADARNLREEKQRLYAQGLVGLESFLEARREYNEVVRDYLEALARYRRDGFQLNTAVGQRLVQ